jgi:hypothetical protein
MCWAHMCDGMCESIMCWAHMCEIMCESIMCWAHMCEIMCESMCEIMCALGCARAGVSVSYATCYKADQRGFYQHCYTPYPLNYTHRYIQSSQSSRSSSNQVRQVLPVYLCMCVHACMCACIALLGLLQSSVRERGGRTLWSLCLPIRDCAQDGCRAGCSCVVQCTHHCVVQDATVPCSAHTTVSCRMQLCHAVHTPLCRAGCSCAMQCTHHCVVQDAAVPYAVCTRLSHS